MALKTGVGGRYSDSFVTLTEADTILAGLPDDVSAWTSLTDTEKEYRLKLAAQIIGYLPLRGKMIYRGQALCFPRSGGIWPPKEIPPEVKEVQAMIAYSVVHRALVNRPTATEETGSKVSSVSLGGLLSVSFAIGKSATVGNGNLMDMLSASINFPIYVRMKRWLGQLRGTQGTTTVTYSLSTTTTETTTSTSSSSTTTSTTN